MRALGVLLVLTVLPLRSPSRISVFWRQAAAQCSQYFQNENDKVCGKLTGQQLYDAALIGDEAKVSTLLSTHDAESFINYQDADGATLHFLFSFESVSR